MSVQAGDLTFLRFLKMFIFVAAIAYQVNGGLDARQLEENTGDAGMKCTTACTQSPPPPSPPPPCPPPPVLLPPPPAPKKPPTQYCPPPPSSFIYITGPPGNLYPIDSDFNGSNRIFTASWPLLVGCGLMGLLAFW